MSTGKRLVLAVGGGIAAYKTAAVVSRLSQRGHTVRVAMTDAAQQFIGPSTLSALSGGPVATKSFDPATHPLGAHIELARHCDLFVVAPATADLLAKFSQGIADCLVTTLYLQITAPVLLAPAMSNVMWEKKAVQRNIRQLQEDGAKFVGPDSGWLSCREQGPGRMSEPEALVDAIEQYLA